MKKSIAYGVVAGVIAAASLIVATPAHAGMTMTIENLPPGIEPQINQGGSLLVTVSENFSPSEWCGGSTGVSGYKMAIYLNPVGGGDSIVLPEGVDSAAQGFGDFGITGVIGDTVSATVVIPETVPVGEYSIAAACQNFVNLGIVYVDNKQFSGQTLRVNAPRPSAPADQLPDTGQESATIFFGTLGAIALVALGAVVIVIRRRVA